MKLFATQFFVWNTVESVIYFVFSGGCIFVGKRSEFCGKTRAGALTKGRIPRQHCGNNFAGDNFSCLFWNKELLGMGSILCGNFSLEFMKR